jgi:hypothetical protein
VVFRVVTPCRFVGGCLHFRQTCSICRMTIYLVNCVCNWVSLWTYTLRPWRWRQQFPPERRYPPTKLHGVTSQETTVVAVSLMEHHFLTDGMSKVLWPYTRVPPRLCRPHCSSGFPLKLVDFKGRSNSVQDSCFVSGRPRRADLSIVSSLLVTCLPQAQSLELESVILTHTH